jgi:hypothetical protein
MPVPVGFERLEELVDLAFGQVLAYPVSVVGLAPGRRDWSHNSRSDELELGRFHGLCPPVR